MGMPKPRTTGFPAEIENPSRQATHCVAPQVVVSTIKKTAMIWPQRRFSWRLDFSGAFYQMPSPALAPEVSSRCRPLRAIAGDVLG